MPTTMMKNETEDGTQTLYMTVCGKCGQPIKGDSYWVCPDCGPECPGPKLVPCDIVHVWQEERIEN
jgi:hypothetical protein